MCLEDERINSYNKLLWLHILQITTGWQFYVENCCILITYYICRFSSSIKTFIFENFIVSYHFPTRNASFQKLETFYFKLFYWKLFSIVQMNILLNNKTEDTLQQKCFPLATFHLFLKCLFFFLFFPFLLMMSNIHKYKYT